MPARHFQTSTTALILLTALTISACGQSPATAPSTPSAAVAEVEASGLFKSPNELKVLRFLKDVAGARKITKLDVSETRSGVETFTVTAQVAKPGSFVFPRYVDQQWEGTIKYLGPDLEDKLIYFELKGRYLNAIPGQPKGPGPLMRRRVGIR